MDRKNTFILYGIIVVAFAFGVAFYAFGDKGGNMITVKSDDKIVREINLDTVTVPFSFTVQNNGFNVVEVENGKIRVTDADCPDKLCIKQSESGTFPIVCLPHRLVIDKK